MTEIKKAVEWAIGIANDNSHGYSQVNRWGADYDCSSLVISAFEQAGVKVKQGGATYTGNMREVFLRYGFKDVTKSVNLVSGAGLQYGDVLLNIINHTALYIGGGNIVHARSSEGNSVQGDGSGNEIRTQPYFNYPWDCVLRLSSEGEGEGAPTKVKAKEYLQLGDSGNQVKMLQTLLIANGFSCGAEGADGDYGVNTFNAVKAFQEARGLEVDGLAGKETYIALLGF